jgi:hypothetical protein
MRATIGALLAAFCAGTHISASCFTETPLVGRNLGVKVSDIPILHNFIEDSMYIMSFSNYGKLNGLQVMASKPIGSALLLGKHGNTNTFYVDWVVPNNEHITTIEV